MNLAQIFYCMRSGHSWNSWPCNGLQTGPLIKLSKYVIAEKKI